MTLDTIHSKFVYGRGAGVEKWVTDVLIWINYPQRRTKNLDELWKLHLEGTGHLKIVKMYQILVSREQKLDVRPVLAPLPLRASPVLQECLSEVAHVTQERRDEVQALCVY